MNKHINYTLVLLLITILLSSCLDEYAPPEIVNNNPILVIEGSITDKETKIRLTQTSSLEKKELIPINDAKIRLENQNGNFQYNLTLDKQGIYKAIISLNYNDKYRIRILSKGDEYVSEFSSLLPTSPIGSLGWEILENKFHVHLNTTSDENFSKYYLWSFEEAWAYDSGLTSNYIYDDGEIRLRTPKEKIKNCWNTPSNTLVQIGTTVGLEQNVVFKQPIQIIDPTENLKLSKRYSILVKQYAISEEAFKFWELLKRNTENVGTIFDAQPSQLPTNITCVNNPNKAVIGYLFTSQEQHKRIYVSRSKLVFDGLPFISDCTQKTFPVDPVLLNRVFKSQNTLITNPLTDELGTIIGYIAASKSCTDCRSQGGKLQKPDFWID